MHVVFERIKEDMEAIRAHDPAAPASNFAIFLNYPGMRAIWAYRRQHWLWTRGFKGLARYLSTRTRKKFGVEIHPGAQIGRRFVIDHGMGIVVGETTIIGDDCMIFQGVTLGGTGKETGKRHPTLKNRVMVGVGAKVLGNITLEDDVKVGGGAVVVKDAPAESTVVGVPGQIVTASGKRIKTPSVDLSTKSDEVARLEVERLANVEHITYLPDPFDMSLRRVKKQTEELLTRIEHLEECVEKTKNSIESTGSSAKTAECFDRVLNDDIESTSEAKKGAQ